MLGGDSYMEIIHYLIKTGHTLEYALSLDEYEKILVYSSMMASIEEENRKWQ